MYLSRQIPLEKTLKTKSVILLGPRRTGKSALVRNQIQADKVYDLLQADVFQALSARPSILRESLRPQDKLIVIDEVQKLPTLLDEVHSLIEERGLRFVLTGSSARKLQRSHTSLMAGRARRLYLHPFCFPELGERFDLGRALALGTLPHVALTPDKAEAWMELRDYSGDYLREEILAEALVRKIEAFSRFLAVAARMNGELLNFEAIGNDSQVPSRTIREYYAVLNDTLVGAALEPHRLKGKLSRKSIATAKFYFFDCGVANALVGRKSVASEAPELGVLFETWLHNELRAYIDYRLSGDAALQFWRAPSGENEVDFLLNEEIAIEVKYTRSASERHCRGLLALQELKKLKRLILVSRDPARRRIGPVEIWPWREFAEALWHGQFVAA